MNSYEILKNSHIFLYLTAIDFFIDIFSVGIELPNRNEFSVLQISTSSGKDSNEIKEFGFNLFMLSNEVEIKQQKINYKKKKKEKRVESLFHKLLASMTLFKLSLVHFSRAHGYLTHFNGNSLSECSSRDQMANYLEILNW